MLRVVGLIVIHKCFYSVEGFPARQNINNCNGLLGSLKIHIISYAVAVTRRLRWCLQVLVTFG